jgi:hypothetical protein
MSGVTNIEGSSLLAANDPSIAQNISNDTQSTNGSIASQYGSGNTQARGLLNSGNSGMDSSIDYGNNALTQAIQNRYSQGFNQNQATLNTSIMQNADADHLQNLQVATGAATQEVELNRQKALLAWKIDQANKKARGQILGTTLGIVGGVIGGVAGGYATGGVEVGAGAAAGYGLGAGVGQSIGQG